MMGISFKSSMAVVFGVCLLLGIWVTGAGEVQAYDYSYKTESYDIKANVKEDNSVIVNETITVNFVGNSHGIYRYIPLEGNTHYTVNGEKVNLKKSMKIDRIQVQDYQFNKAKRNGNMEIRIGDPDATVTGKHIYRISYRCRLYDDGISAYDLFYFNVLPDKWTTPIQSVTATIHMPKTFSKDKLDVYAGQYGTNSYGDRIQTQVDGQNITINSQGQFPANVGITLQEFLPEGYFVNEMTTDWAYLAMLAIAIFAALVTVILWILFGRDRTLIRPVEFYPAEGLTSAEIGYVIDSAVDKKDIVSMIIYLADKGYLEIKETDKSDFIFRKLKPLPEDAKPFEHTIMNGLFPNKEKDITFMSELKEKFYDSYSAAVLQIKSQYKDRSKRLYTKTGNIARIVSAVLMAVPVSGGLLLGSIYKRVENIPILALVASALLLVIYLSGLALYDKRESLSTAKYQALNILFGAGAVIVLAVSLSRIIAYAGVFAGLVCVISSLIGYICTRQMRQLTPYGAQLMGKILGFKYFIETAELSKIKLLAEENPSYFYGVLPYAYVFGLSEVWSKKFETIIVEPPVWFNGQYGGTMFNTWIFIHALHSCTNGMQNSIAVPLKTDGGGGDFSAGSFGGGGGFSGGGFGGGGGGAW